MKKRYVRFILNSTILLLTIILYYFFSSKMMHFLKCPFYLLTGFYCPGCGSQRALESLLHGNVISAIHYNALMIVSLPFIIFSAVVFTLNTFREKQVTQHLFYSNAFAVTTFFIVALFWALRNININSGNPLAPHA